MNLWNLKGVRISLSRGPKSTVQEPSPDSVFKMGAAIPIFSRIFVGQRIRHRENAVAKIGRKLDKMVTVEKGKIEKVIAAAERTDINSLIVKAHALEDKLNQAACKKTKFVESEDDSSDGSEGGSGRVKKLEPLGSRCIRAIIKGVFDKTDLTGKTNGSLKDGTSTFKDTMVDLQGFHELCIKNNGKVTIPAGVVDAYGVKTGDVEINVEN